MARNESRRVGLRFVEADRKAFAALETMGGYEPPNAVYSVTAVRELRDALDAARVVEAQAAAAAAAARDTAAAKEWEFHNAMLGVKAQVVALFGRDSNEVQALGLKKSSEIRAGRRAKGVTRPQE